MYTHFGTVRTTPGLGRTLVGRIDAVVYCCVSGWHRVAQLYSERICTSARDPLGVFANSVCTTVDGRLMSIDGLGGWVDHCHVGIA